MTGPVIARRLADEAIQLKKGLAFDSLYWIATARWASR
jgi:hypothetical protein